jgi:hypothetical protein
MKKFITVCFILCAAITLVGAQTGFAYETIEGGCLPCHSKGTLHSLHSVSCTACHPGASGNTPIPSANCIICHPPADPGVCPLIFVKSRTNPTVNAHPQSTCLGCHTTLSGCQAPVTTTTTTSVQSTTTTTTITCSYSISPTSKTFRASGGKGAVRVSTANGCDWKATSTYSWITITSGASGSGSGRVSYTVATNPDTTERTGSMDIAGETFTVLQAGRRR